VAGDVLRRLNDSPPRRARHHSLGFRNNRGDGKVPLPALLELVDTDDALQAVLLCGSCDAVGEAADHDGPWLRERFIRSDPGTLWRPFLLQLP